MKQGELLIKERLRELENQMIGGEKANDSHLKEKRANRKQLADAKINAIKDALQHVDDDDNLLIKAYGDITEELKNKNQLLKKAKKRLTSLEQDVKDLQSEFEVERTDCKLCGRWSLTIVTLHLQTLTDNPFFRSRDNPEARATDETVEPDNRKVSADRTRQGRELR